MCTHTEILYFFQDAMSITINKKEADKNPLKTCKKTKNIQVYIKEFNHNFDNLFASIVFLIRKNNDCNYLCKQSKYQKKYEKMINKDLMNLIKNSLKKCMDILISSFFSVYDGKLTPRIILVYSI